MKALYFTDLHLWDRDISTRRDRSSQAALGKLRFLTQTAVARGCDFLISGGDFHQDKIDSDEYKAAIVETLLSCPSVRKFTLVGNHDILWRTYGTYRKRAMGILSASKSIEILDLQLLDQGFLGISAFNESIMERVPDPRLVWIIFAHHYINQGSDRLVLKVKELKEKFPNLQYIFTGHDHMEYPTVDIQGVHVVRPGGAMRVSSSMENTNRQPKALLIEWSDLEPLRIEEIMIPCLPAAEAFNLDIKTVAKSVEHQMDEFMDTIASSKIVGYDLETVVLEKLQTLNDPELAEYVHGDLANLLTA